MPASDPRDGDPAAAPARDGAGAPARDGVGEPARDGDPAAPARVAGAGAPARDAAGARDGDPDPLAQLLAGAYRDPDAPDGPPLAAAARALVIADSLADREVELVAALGLGPRLAIVADDDTWAAL